MFIFGGQISRSCGSINFLRYRHKKQVRHIHRTLVLCLYWVIMHSSGELHKIPLWVQHLDQTAKVLPPCAPPWLLHSRLQLCWVSPVPVQFRNRDDIYSGILEITSFLPVFFLWRKCNSIPKKPSLNPIWFLNVALMFLAITGVYRMVVFV